MNRSNHTYCQNTTNATHSGTFAGFVSTDEEKASGFLDSKVQRDSLFSGFVFTGKERDEETGYGYFGARYMDHELTTMWLSVDPMADKYPNISPYAYCNWNPIGLVDPNGMDTITFNSDGRCTGRIKADGPSIGKIIQDDGANDIYFRFLYEQDAERCCVDGSDEYFNMLGSDRTEENCPITSVKIIRACQINNYLSKLGKMGIIDRLLYALSESKGGEMDFSFHYFKSSGTLYVPMIYYGNDKVLYGQNNMNFGNYLWGAAMCKLGFSSSTTISGANVFALLEHHEFDASDDKFSIRLGYNFYKKFGR